MSNTTRKTIFEQAARKLRQDFQELSVVPHKALKGGEAEKLIRAFLRNHLPKRFDVGAGFIIDKKDNISKQTDVVVYDAFNCPVYRASDEAAIFPNDNVAAVVEVKSLLDKDRFIEAFNNLNEAKALAKTTAPEIPFNPIQTNTMGCLFAFESAISLEKIAEHYSTELSKGKCYFIDIIVVLDLGIITLACKTKHFPGWNLMYFEGMGGEEAEGAHLAVAVLELGTKSLDAFLRLLLAHLTYFRNIVDHPGLDFGTSDEDNLMKLRYIGSVTNEKDPILRKQKLEQYAREVREDFSKSK